MVFFWRNLLACLRRQSGQEDEVELGGVSKPERRIPILKLPDVVFSEFMKQLEAIDILKLSFTSKRTHEICKRFSWKHPRAWIEYRYPPQLRLCFDGIHTTTYIFKEESEKKENEVYLEQTVEKYSDLAVDFSSRDQKDFIVYSTCPYVVTYSWARYFRRLFKIQQYRLYVKPGNDKEHVKKYVKRYIAAHARQVSHLTVDVDLDAPGNVTDRVHMGGDVVRCFQVHSTVMYNLGHPYMYRSFNATHANLQAALAMKHYYVDLKNATITDEELSWMVKRWWVDVEDEDVEFKTISVRRNYGRKLIEWDLLLRGVVYERLQDNETRQYGRLSDNSLGIEQHPCMGGIDIFRDDGEILSIYIECDSMRVVDPNDEDELVSVPNPDSHVIHFVSWWPEEGQE